MDKITFVKEILHRCGVDIIRYHPQTHPVARRLNLLSKYHVDMVFDVGANTGQFAQELRSHGYRGRIISFEPLTSAYRNLVKNLQSDPLWKGINIALGDAEESSEINVSENSFSSSILNILPIHLASAPESSYIAKEKITVRRLDSILSDHYAGESLYLKIDTQGFEDKVLAGAEKSLSKIIGIQLELSLVPLYEGQALFFDLYQQISACGFSLVALEPGFADPAGRLLQVDGIFYRT